MTVEIRIRRRTVSLKGKDRHTLRRHAQRRVGVTRRYAPVVLAVVSCLMAAQMATLIRGKHRLYCMLCNIVIAESKSGLAWCNAQRAPGIYPSDTRRQSETRFQNRNLFISGLLRDGALGPCPVWQGLRHAQWTRKQQHTPPSTVDMSRSIRNNIKIVPFCTDLLLSFLLSVTTGVRATLAGRCMCVSIANPSVIRRR